MRSDYEKLINYAFRILAKKRYTASEIGKKLRNFSKMHDLEDDSLVESVVGRLEELKYIDDRQYASDYVNDRVKLKPRGEFLLRRELKMKGIGEDLIEDVVKDKEIDDFELAKAAFEKKLRQWRGPDDSKVKQRAFAFLSSRGFTPDTIYKVLNNWYDRRSLE